MYDFLKQMHPIILIPSRLNSRRFPNKPLAEIHGEPMIVHVWRRAIEADLGPVVVACQDIEIAEVIESVGGEAELTASHHVSGSDRIYEAVQARDPEGRYDVVLNLQGDLPTIKSEILRSALHSLEVLRADIGTAAAPLKEDEIYDKNVVKVLIDPISGTNMGSALDFFRTTDNLINKTIRHHIGIYAYRRPVLSQFVELQPTASERKLGLEQLRAMDAGMTIGVGLVDTFPLGVDTPADLLIARDRISTK